VDLKHASILIATADSTGIKSAETKVMPLEEREVELCGQVGAAAVSSECYACGKYERWIAAEVDAAANVLRLPR